MTSKTFFAEGVAVAAACLLTLLAPVARAAEVPLALAPDKVGSGPRIVYLYPDYPFTLDPQNGSSFANALGLQFFDTLITYEMEVPRGLPLF